MRRVFVLTAFIVDEYYKKIDIKYKNCPISDRFETLQELYKIIREDEKELGKEELTPYRCVKQDFQGSGRFVLDMGDKRKKIYMVQTLIFHEDFYGNFTYMEPGD